MDHPAIVSYETFFMSDTHFYYVSHVQGTFGKKTDELKKTPSNH